MSAMRAEIGERFVWVIDWSSQNQNLLGYNTRVRVERENERMPNDNFYWFLRRALRSGALVVKLKFSFEVSGFFKKFLSQFYLFSYFLLYDEVGEFPVVTASGEFALRPC